ARAGAKELVRDIADALSDPDVRRTALLTLWAIGPDAATDGASRVADLLDTDKSLRPELIRTLAEMNVSGPTADQVVPKLIAVFANESRLELRRNVAEVLGRIGKPALEPLRQALKNPTAAVRGGAAMSLGAMGAEAESAIQG